MWKNKIFIYIFLASVFFILVGTLWLSESRETLDEVAGKLGASENPVWSPPFPDYTLQGFENNLAANILLGIIATLAAFTITYIAARAFRTKNR